MSPTSTNTCINTLTTSWVVISHSKCWTINWQRWNKQNGISQLATQHSQRIPLHKWILGPLVLATTHPCWAYSFLASSTESQHTAPHLGQGMIPTHFHLQDQSWQLHNNIGNLHVEQPHSTKSLPTVQLSYHSKNYKQLQQFLPQYITHILIIYLH